MKLSLLLPALLVVVSLISKLIYSSHQINPSSEIQEYLSTNRWKKDSSILIDSRSIFSAMSVCLPLIIYGVIDILLVYQKIFI